jgi:hypothetical protein
MVIGFDIHGPKMKRNGWRVNQPGNELNKAKDKL